MSATKPGPIHRITVVIDVYGADSPTDAKEYIETVLDLTDGVVYVDSGEAKLVAVRS